MCSSRRSTAKVNVLVNVLVNGATRGGLDYLSQRGVMPTPLRLCAFAL